MRMDAATRVGSTVFRRGFSSNPPRLTDEVALDAGYHTAAFLARVFNVLAEWVFNDVAW